MEKLVQTHASLCWRESSLTEFRANDLDISAFLLKTTALQVVDSDEGVSYHYHG